jgi:hypothetical protein
MMTIKAKWIDLRGKLRQDLSRFYVIPVDTTGQILRRYALVDAAQVPELRSAEFLSRPFECISLFALTREHGIAKYGPLLVPLDDTTTSPVTARVLRSMRRGWTVSWLSSALSLQDLAEHLAGHLNGTLPDGTDVLVRYYDPRVLPSFLVHLDAATREALLAPIGHWAWWDRKLDFVIEKGDGRAVSSGITHIQVPAEMQKAMAVAAMDDLINGLIVAEADDGEFVKWLPHTLYTAISRQLHSARNLGLSVPADLQLFVSLALRVHPDFFELLPVFARERERLSNGEVDMPTLVLGMEDDDWNRLGSIGETALEQLRQSITDELCMTSTQLEVNGHGI